MSLKIEDFLDHLNRRGTLSPVSENTKKDYRSSLEQFQSFLDGRQPAPELAQEWIQQLLDKGRKPATDLFIAPHAITLDSEGSIYVGEVAMTAAGVDRGRRTVQKFARRT